MKLKPRHSTLWLASLSTTVLIGILFVAAPRINSGWVTWKYGQPRQICLGAQRIEFSDAWWIQLLDQGQGGWPLLYGTLSIPPFIAKLEPRQPFLHLSSHQVASLALAPRAGLFDRSQAVSDCEKNSACTVSVLMFREAHQAVVVQLDGGYAATLLDIPLHVQVHGSAPTVPLDVHVGSCNGQVGNWLWLGSSPS